MNLDSLSFTLSQIGYLVGSLGRRSGSKEALQQRLAELVNLHGLEADRHLLRCLFSSADFTTEPKVLATSPHNQLLAERCSTVINKAVLVTSICGGVAVATDSSLNSKGLQVGPQLLQQLSKCLRLTPVQEVVFALALCHADDVQVADVARTHLRTSVPVLVQSYIDTEGSSRQHEGGLHDATPEIAHLILGAVLRSPKDVGLTGELHRSFLGSLRRDFPQELVPVVLAPLIYPDRCELAPSEMSSEGPGLSGGMLDTALYDLVSDIGYAFTASVDECRGNLLKLVGPGAGRDLNEALVARTLSFMCRTCNNNLDDAFKDGRVGGSSAGWNAEVFVQALKEVSPNLSWNVVVLELDHPEFVIKDRQSLVLLISALRMGLQGLGFHADTFPVDHFYRRWSNVEGQLGLIQQVLKNPDVFSFADYAFHSVPVDVLKTPPEQDGKELANWRNVNLVELLLALSECGLYAQVQELFKVPVQLCPDVLILTLTNIQGSITLLRQELISNLIPTFLGNHPNSAIILHHAWNSMTLNVKHIIMHSMAEWYHRGECDQTRLSRILDVAQDLKALSLLLNAQSYPFIIDLACLASRREYLKLEKWLTDKIREHGEPFVTACLKFLQRRCPQLFGKPDDLSKGHGLPKETVSTILMCLQSVASGMSAECQEAIVNVANQGSFLFKMNQPPQHAAAAAASSLLRSQQRAALEGSFNPSTISAPMYNATVDSIAGLNSTLAGITLGPTTAPFNLQGGLGPLVSSPGSPSRILGAGPPNSPFLPMMQAPPPMQHQGPVGSAAVAAVSLGANVNATMNNISRLESLNLPDKIKIQDLFPEVPTPVAKEIEDEANSYFQRIYNLPQNPTLSIDEVLEMLKKFQESPIQKEREIFRCMLRNLFEEYKFFPIYPDKELYITAQLFGGIIEHGLITNVRLGVALCCIFDSLSKPKTSKMYNFGLIAVDRFKSQLKHFTQFCKRVKTCTNFNDFPSHLIEYIEYGSLNMEPPNKPGGAVVPTNLSALLSGQAGGGGGGGATPTSQNYPGGGGTGGKSAPGSTPAGSAVGGNNGGKSANSSQGSSLNASTRPSIANATNIDTLLVATEKDEKVISPPESLQDKTAFIFNNLSQLNLQSKCEELRELVSDEYWPWISQYLVMKRASIELNFHGLYSNFLDMLKINEVNRMVTKETFRNIKVLLRSDKGIANFSDRSLLKNLGHWLGILTLGRNKPILQSDIDLKALLVEAYHKGQQELLYVVPFVAKVLESCAKSRVFKPPNPWTMGIMNVLGELHVEPDLKLNLKFEIEVLCKTLGLEVGSLKPIVYLKDPERVRRLEYQLSQPAKKESIGILSVQQNQQQQQQASVMVHGSVVNTGIVNDSDLVVGQVASIASVVASSPPISQINSSTTPTSGLTTAPEPRFNYSEIQTAGTQALQTHLVLSPNIMLFQTNPSLKHLVRTAVERAVQEWIAPVVDRAIKIAATTCEHIIRKDFALDSEEVRIRNSAHSMARYLTAGMVMITCRDQLLGSINTHLKNLLQSAMPTASSQQKEMIEQAASLVAQDNMELGCAFIQKTAIEKVIPEIDKRLSTEYELRKIARQEGRRYWDGIALSFQTERMPEPIRSKINHITSTQYAVYEEFARNIPGFQALTERDVVLFAYKPGMEVNAAGVVAAVTAPQVVAAHSVVNQAAFQQVNNNTNEDVIGVYEKLVAEVESFVQGTLSHQNMTAMHNNLHMLHEYLVLTIKTRDILTTGPSIIQKCVEGLQDSLATHVANDSNDHIILRYKEIFVRTLKAMQDPRAFGAQWTNKQVTRLLVDTREEYRYNFDAIETLIRAGLVTMPQFDAALAQMIDNGHNYMAVTFATQLVQMLLIDDRSCQCVAEGDFPNTLEVLAKVAAHVRTPPDGLTNVLEVLRQGHDQTLFFGDRASAGPSVHLHNGILQVRSLNYEDPPGLVEKTDFLLRDWISIYHSQPSGRDSTKAFSLFVHQMNVHGILKTDDLITRFFRLSTQLCVETVYRNMSEAPNNNMNIAQIRSKCYHTLDPFVRLIALLVKHSGDLTNTSTKIHLLNKVLGIVAGCLLQDHEQRGLDFQQLPYHRIFVMLYLELCSPEPVLESINFQVLTAYCHTLHILRPAKAPGFCYAWLELISHRVFIGRMLALTPQQKGWNMYAQLLVDLFKYLAPFLRNAELAKPVTMLYKGSLRVLLVLLHDFPEFLCDYHYGFCDVIPPNCVQLRNLILSAFPRNMRLPDPFTPNLKVDVLQEITYAPRIVTNFAALVTPAQFKKDLDMYLKARAPVTFLSDIRGNLQVSSEPGMRYNIPLMNALVMYVGTQAIASIRAKGLAPNMSTIAHSAHMDIFQNLAVDLDTEGRYLFLNAVANQLRYPNSHTHYFSCTLLYLFAEANTEAIQEQITRVLLERLIVNRPHPWGLLITFIELIKNPTYKFWNHEFVHCAPEIEKLFESVARSCMVQKTPVQSQEGAGGSDLTE